MLDRGRRLYSWFCFSNQGRKKYESSGGKGKRGTNLTSLKSRRLPEVQSAQQSRVRIRPLSSPLQTVYTICQSWVTTRDKNGIVGWLLKGLQRYKNNHQSPPKYMNEIYILYVYLYIHKYILGKVLSNHNTGEGNLN